MESQFALSLSSKLYYRPITHTATVVLILEDCHIFFILAISLRELRKYLSGKFSYLCMYQFQYSLCYIQHTTLPFPMLKDKLQRLVGRLGHRYLVLEQKSPL